jgi:hypothetical protein
LHWQLPVLLFVTSYPLLATEVHKLGSQVKNGYFAIVAKQLGHSGVHWQQVQVLWKLHHEVKNCVLDRSLILFSFYNIFTLTYKLCLNFIPVLPMGFTNG